VRIDLIDNFEIICGKSCKEYKCIVPLEPKYKVKTEACKLSTTESAFMYTIMCETQYNSLLNSSSEFKFECFAFNRFVKMSTSGWQFPDVQTPIF
jgi:hypothetical protein